MSYNLYYLVDQSGDINGDKTLTGSFTDIDSAKDKATTDAIQHYSVELVDGDTNTIVFIV